MSLVSQISALATRIATEINAIRTEISGISGGGAPDPHASTHASGGSDPVTLAQSQITNLTTDLAAKANLAGPTFSGNVGIGGTATTARFEINAAGGSTPNFIMQGNGEQTFRFYNTASTGSTRVSWKMASRLNTDWNWILYTDSADNGTNDLTFQNLNGMTMRLNANKQIIGNFASQIFDRSAGFTIQNSEAGQTIRSTGGAITVTVTDVLNTGDRIDFIQDGTGQITFAASGVTLQSKGGKLKTAAQYSAVTLIKVAASQYRLIGDLG